MEKSNPDLLKMTKNDQQVLKHIVLQAKITDKKIAEKIGISPQAVFKIRNKLEQSGIIKGYIPIIDFKKIGIRVMAILIIKLTAEVWDKYTDGQISERMQKIPYVINAYRIPQSKVSHILLMGFRNVEQMNAYMTKMQTMFSREVEVQEVYPFSIDNVITQSPVGLLYEIVNKTEFPVNEFFLKQPEKKK